MKIVCYIKIQGFEKMAILAVVFGRATYKLVLVVGWPQKYLYMRLKHALQIS